MVEGGALLRRYTGLNPYRGFESLSLRHESGTIVLILNNNYSSKSPYTHQFTHHFAQPSRGTVREAELVTPGDEVQQAPRLRSPLELG